MGIFAGDVIGEWRHQLLGENLEFAVPSNNYIAARWAIAVEIC